MPVEASGHDWFTLEWGDQWLEHVEAVKPDYAKVLGITIPQSLLLRADEVIH